MQNILLLDPERCVGCRRCMVACSFAKGNEVNLTKSRIETLWIPQIWMNVPMVCQHCVKPICADACPVNAISRNEQTGAAVIDPSLCIGCKMCMIVCPFGGPSLDLDTGLMIKCDLCDGDPECVKNCMHGALTYVPADEAVSARRRSR